LINLLTSILPVMGSKVYYNNINLFYYIILNINLILKYNIK